MSNGGVVNLPRVTRLRFCRAKSPTELEAYCRALGIRIQIYSIAHDGKAWVMWFVPDDSGKDIQSVDLTTL